MKRHSVSCLRSSYICVYVCALGWTVGKLHTLWRLASMLVRSQYCYPHRHTQTYTHTHPTVLCILFLCSQVKFYFHFLVYKIFSFWDFYFWHFSFCVELEIWAWGKLHASVQLWLRHVSTLNSLVCQPSMQFGGILVSVPSSQKWMP